MDARQPPPRPTTTTQARSSLPLCLCLSSLPVPCDCPAPIHQAHASKFVTLTRTTLPPRHTTAHSTLHSHAHVCDTAGRLRSANGLWRPWCSEREQPTDRLHIGTVLADTRHHATRHMPYADAPAPPMLRRRPLCMRMPQIHTRTTWARARSRYAAQRKRSPLPADRPTGNIQTCGMIFESIQHISQAEELNTNNTNVSNTRNC